MVVVLVMDAPVGGTWTDLMQFFHKHGELSAVLGGGKGE